MQKKIKILKKLQSKGTFASSNLSLSYKKKQEVTEEEKLYS